MIRLRQSIEFGLRHPLLGPLLLLLLGLMLAFVVLHTIEHGVAELVSSCVLAAAVALRLVVVLGRTWRAAIVQLPVFGRAPPSRGLGLRPAGLIATASTPPPLRL